MNSWWPLISFFCGRAKEKLYRRIFVCFACSLSGGLCAATSPIVLVWGDSLSSGYGLPADTSWPQLLQRKLQEEGYKEKVINLSVSGTTTAEGVSRLPLALSRMEDGEPQIMILALGANDALRGLSLDQAQNNLQQMIVLAKKRGAKILLVGIRLPPNLGVNTKVTKLYFSLANKYHLPLVPSLLEKIETKVEYFQADGMHPTAVAQPLILETVWQKLATMLKK